MRDAAAIMATVGTQMPAIAPSTSHFRRLLGIPLGLLVLGILAIVAWSCKAKQAVPQIPAEQSPQNGRQIDEPQVAFPPTDSARQLIVAYTRPLSTVQGPLAGSQANS